MEFTCKDGGNSSGGQCPCENPVWDRSVFTETVQTKYTIICEKEWMVSFSQSMLYLGTLFGALLFGYLSDRYGRLSTFSMSSLVIATAGCLVPVMPTVTSFMLMRCIEGIGVGGAIVTGYVLVVEYCGTKYRELVTAFYHVPINVSHVSLAGISYFIRHCDAFQLALSVPAFLCVTLWCFCLESPKWLITDGNIDKATRVMEKIAAFNRKPSDNIKAEIEEYHAAQSSAETHKLRFWQIFLHKRLTINLLCMSFIYFVCGMGYYGVSQYIGKMSGDIHRNVAISGAILIPGTITSAFLLKYFGRRSFLMATCFLSGIFMIIVIIIPENQNWARVVTACVCNTFFFMSFIIVFLYGVELFPTSIRNTVLGFLSVLSRVGQITAPPINSLPPLISGAIFGAMAIIGGFLCLPLPETKNVELPSSLEDVESN
uniref:Major facilitator superfamily (MFS) profile domain-containing protein n=1 Tax=Heliothis virescens TaxID=7102 RepID=A0A2A4IZU9_HELVI